MTSDVEFVDEESPRAADPAMIGLLEVVLAGITVPGSSLARLVSSSRAASLAFFWLWTEFSLTLALGLGIDLGGLPRAAEMLSDIFRF